MKVFFGKKDPFPEKDLKVFFSLSSSSSDAKNKSSMYILS